MKILLVDDDEVRSQKILDHLGNSAGVTIDLAQDGLEARSALAHTQYDLMILDVLLPLRPDQQPSHGNSLSILTEVSETNNLLKPRHIIGLTAYRDAEQAVAPEFIERAWVLVRSEELNHDWLQTIANAVEYIQQQLSQFSQHKYGVDLLVITALRHEMEAVHRLPWNWTADEPLDNCTFFSRGSFSCQDKDCSVVSAVASRMGMVTTAILASKLISRFHPKALVMPGISAGVRGRTEVGDVICAEMTWDYQSGKHVIDSEMLPDFLIDPHFIQIDEAISSRWSLLARDTDLPFRIWQGWPDPPPSPPRLLRGPVACGSAVLANSDVTNAILLQQRKLLGVEMELYGAYLASEHADRPKPLAMGIKSVCDFADAQKANSFQSYAAYVSASLMRAFFEKFMNDL